MGKMDPSTGLVSIADSGNLRSKSYQIALCAVDSGGKYGRSVLRVDVKTRSVKNDEVELQQQQQQMDDSHDDHDNDDNDTLKDFDVGDNSPQQRRQQHRGSIKLQQQQLEDDRKVANEPKATEK